MTRETGDKVRTGPGMQQGLQLQRGGGGVGGEGTEGITTILNRYGNEQALHHR